MISITISRIRFRHVGNVVVTRVVTDVVCPDVEPILMEVTAIKDLGLEVVESCDVVCSLVERIFGSGASEREG